MIGLVNIGPLCGLTTSVVLGIPSHNSLGIIKYVMANVVWISHTSQVFYFLPLVEDAYPLQQHKFRSHKHSPALAWPAHRIQWSIDRYLYLNIYLPFPSLCSQLWCFEPPHLLGGGGVDEAIPICFWHYHLPPSMSVVIISTPPWSPVSMLTSWPADILSNAPNPTIILLLDIRRSEPSYLIFQLILALTYGPSLSSSLISSVNFHPQPFLILKWVNYWTGVGGLSCLSGCHCLNKVSRCLSEGSEAPSAMPTLIVFLPVRRSGHCVCSQ